MKLRIMGLPGEVAQVVKALAESSTFDVLEVSDPRPNRGESRLVRVYAEVRVNGTTDSRRNGSKEIPS